MRYQQAIRVFVLAAIVAFNALAVESLQIEAYPAGVEKRELADHGRGVCIGKDLVLTCWHVVETDGTANPVAVKVGEKLVDGQVVASDKMHDLALIKMPADCGLKVYELIDAPRVEIIGAAGNALPKVKLAKIVHAIVLPDEKIADTPDGCKGWSGSPAVIEGRVLGLVHAAFQHQKQIRRVLSVGPDGVMYFVLDHEPVGEVHVQITAPHAIEELLSTYRNSNK